jgi:hypothetical protein
MKNAGNLCVKWIKEKQKAIEKRPMGVKNIWKD